jgi:uncharacterized protein (UPF0333 family)
MELSFSLLFIGILSLAVGSVLGYLTRQSIAKKQLGTAEGKVNKMLTDAEAQAQSTLLEAKNKAVEALEEVKKDEKKRQEQIFRLENRITRGKFGPKAGRSRSRKKYSHQKSGRNQKN